MRVLVIAPHPDDEVIGVGGTIAKRAEEGHEVYVCDTFEEQFDWVVAEEKEEVNAVKQIVYLE